MHLRLCLLVALLICAGVPRPGFPQAEYNWLEGECSQAFDVSGTVKLPHTSASAAKAKVVINYSGREDHWVVAFQDRELKALKVEHGKVVPPWPPRVLPAAEAYSFVIKRRPDHLSLIVNGELAGRIESGGPAGGKVGSSVSGGMQIESLRLQEVEPVYFTDDFMRTGTDPNVWEPVTGQWEVKAIESAEPDPSRSANPFSFSVAAKEHALAVAGYWFWDDYLFRVAVKPEAPGAIGLVVYYQDPRNYVLFRWWSNTSAQAAKAQQLMWVRGGQKRIASAGGDGYQPGQWYQLAVKANESRVEGSIDGHHAFSVMTPPFCLGKIGLYAERCERAWFDDVLCRHWEGVADDPSPMSDPPHITAQFTREETMTGWTHPENDWTVGAEGWRWNRGDFWGDASLSVELPRPREVGARVMLVIHADSETSGSGYGLAVAVGPDSASLNCVLTRQGKQLGLKHVPVADWPIKIELRRRGKKVLVMAGDEPPLAINDPTPLPGTRTGIQTIGLTIPAEALYATGTHFLDDTFASAPVNWWQGKGKWHVTSRWACQPGWTWFAGTGSLSPIVWSKRAFGGDFTVEAFVASRMDLPGGPGYSHPGDLNMTVCGDGRAPNSGYSFVYAGWNNTCSGLFRQDECLAQNKRAVLAEPTSGNMNFHRHWFCVRVQRQRNRLRHFVDGELVSEYEDPKPIPSGRVALWTCNNETTTGGITVARARIWYQYDASAENFPITRFSGEESGPWDQKLAPVPEDTKSVKHDFETDLAGWSGFNRRDGAVVSLDASTAVSGKQSLLVRNAEFGGDFTVWAGAGQLDALRLRKLRFAYKVPPNVKVNLYLQVQGRYYAIEFTGGPQPPGTCATLGKIENVQADDQWHRAEFDLGGALQAVRPNSAPTQASHLCFSAPKNTYYRVGIGGNGWHASYHIDDFELGQ